MPHALALAPPRPHAAHPDHAAPRGVSESRRHDRRHRAHRPAAQREAVPQGDGRQGHRRLARAGALPHARRHAPRRAGPRHLCRRGRRLSGDALGLRPVSPHVAPAGVGGGAGRDAPGALDHRRVAPHRRGLGRRRGWPARPSRTGGGRWPRWSTRSTAPPATSCASSSGRVACWAPSSRGRWTHSPRSSTGWTPPPCGSPAASPRREPGAATTSARRGCGCCSGRACRFGSVKQRRRVG